MSSWSEDSTELDSVDDRGNDLLYCLDSIQAAGNIATFNSYNLFSNPCLEIKDHGVIPLPLNKHYADIIKNVCRQAPFGRGKKTMVDTSVRNTWELDHSQFHLGNPSWERFLTKTLTDTAKGLGLQKLSAELNKLLLYEPGFFFKRHKDSEKKEGMIGTLVICLPSKHEGGDVHVSFDQQESVFSTASASRYDISTMAWYSDVTHEIKKVTSGYRLVLTYNLFGLESLSATTNRARNQDLRAHLKEWLDTYPGTRKLVYPLRHKYTDASLCLENMKGRDRAVCLTLDDVCSETGFYLLFAHMIHQRVSDYHLYEYGDEESPKTWLTSIRSTQGEVVAADSWVSDGQALGVDYEHRNADSGDDEENLGNEDAPERFRYHDTVVVLVPKGHISQFMAYSPEQHRISRIELFNSLAVIVVRDLEKSHEDLYTKQSAVDFMEMASRTSTDLANSTICEMAMLSLEIKEETLWLICLNYAISHRDCLFRIAHILIGYCGAGDVDIDWDAHFSGLGVSVAWALETLVPNLASRAEPQLLFDVFDPSLERSPHGKAIFESAIQHSGSKLYMRIHEPARLIPFPRLFKSLYAVGLREEASQLFEKSWDTMSANGRPWEGVKDEGDFAGSFMRPMTQIMEKAEYPPTRAAKEFIESALRDVIHRDVAAAPRPVSMIGWARKARGCKSQECEACIELDEFLASQDAECEFQGDSERLAHLKGQLPEHIFGYISWRSYKRPLVVRKGNPENEYRTELSKLQRAIDELVRCVGPFSTDYVRELLGDVKFQELVLLKKPNGEDIWGTVTGAKRGPDTSR